MDTLILRFDAPLLSFGGAVVDNIGVTRRFPARSMLTGLLANALGWDHGDGDRLGALQERVRYAVRCDRAGRELVDFQTVDLGQDFLDGTGWTTRGAVEERKGGEARVGTHIRERHFIADAVYTVALRLVPADEEPTLAALHDALVEPERPLFLGRKCCLPSGPLVVGRVETTSLRAALEAAPVLRSEGGRLAAWWPADEEGGAESRVVTVTDERDWWNQIHVGRRSLRQGWLQGRNAP